MSVPFTFLADATIFNVSRLLSGDFPESPKPFTVEGLIQ